jgi:hypothetical protein
MPFRLWLRYASSTPSKIDEIFCSLRLGTVSVSGKSNGWSNVPVQKTFQLFGQLDLALRWLSLNVCGRFAKVWGDVFGPRLRDGCSCGSPLRIFQMGEWDLHRLPSSGRNPSTRRSHLRRIPHLCRPPPLQNLYLLASGSSVQTQSRF